MNKTATYSLLYICSAGNIIQRKRSVVGRRLPFSTSNQNDQSRIVVEQGDVQLSSETQNLSTPSSEPESQTRGSVKSTFSCLYSILS